MDNFVTQIFYYSDGSLYWKNPKTKRQKIFPAGSIAGNGRLYIRVNEKIYLAHHLIFFYHYSRFPKYIDHINRNPLDNRIENLRETTLVKNSQNRGMNKNNTTGFKGVVKHVDFYIAQIMSDGKNRHLGRFDSAKEAAIAYDDAAKIYHGEVAYQNFPSK